MIQNKDLLINIRSMYITGNTFGDESLSSNLKLIFHFTTIDKHDLQLILIHTCMCIPFACTDVEYSCCK